MTVRRILATLAALLVAIWPSVAPAQDDDDKGFLTNFLEENLSSVGRKVTIDGFAGALSSRATFTRLAIADDTGEWLVITDGAISWNRAALLRGRVDIAEMSAAQIELLRKPASNAENSAASGGFALPELPVSLSIADLNVARVTLASEILGEPLTLSARGKASLADGEGSAEFTASRLESSTSGEFTLSAGYANATRVAAIDLLAAEGAGGVVARLAGLPGQPAVTLAMHGTAPIDDFVLDLALSTNGAPRLSGKIAFGADGGNLETGQRVSVDLRGDVTPLFEPEYRDFFGTSARVSAAARRYAGGRIDLEQLDIASDALTVSGSASLSATGQPERLFLDLSLGRADGSAIVLPVPGETTTVGAADLSLAFDSAAGDGWRIAGTLERFARAGLNAGKVTLSGSGRIQQDAAGGTVAFSASGLKMPGDALSTAVGEGLAGRVVFDWKKDAALRLSTLSLRGEGYSLAGRMAYERGVASGALDAAIQDLSRLSALLGRELGGGVGVSASGSYDLAAGQLDGTVDGAATALRAGIPPVDRLLSGQTVLSAEFSSAPGVLTLRALRLSTGGFAADAAGTLGAAGSDLAATIVLDSLARLDPGFGGSANARLSLKGPENDLRLGVGGDFVDIAVGQAALDAILAGDHKLSADLALQDGTAHLLRLDLEGPALSLAASAPAPLEPLQVNAKLKRTELLAPEFPGETVVTGTIAQAGDYQVDLGLAGPGRADLRLAGSVAQGGDTVDLNAVGSLRAEIANAFIAPRAASGDVSFDLRLSGAPRLENLSGTARLAGARVADPTVFVALEGLSAEITVAAARANISANAAVRGGGQFAANGTVGLASDVSSDIAIDLDRIVLRDSQLFKTTASGALRLEGPLARGGRVAGEISLEETEILVAGAVGGGAGIPEGIVHRNEAAGSRASRGRAGLLEVAAEQRGPKTAMAVDLTIRAPQRIFVRGRGLDAELGGEIRLTGTTADIVPVGDFDLIRGRLDILSKRLTIDEGTVALRGALDPYLRFVASNSSGGVVTTVTLEGPASAPAIHFTSVPELPEEEVVSHLLFGRGIQTLSAFQAAELAAAVATLAGKGGEGITTRLRRAIGVDDLDISTDEEGSTTLTAGKYLTERVYSDVTVNGDGNTEINLNFDVTPRLKARGTVDNEGSTGIGIFFEKDY